MTDIATEGTAPNQEIPTTFDKKTDEKEAERKDPAKQTTQSIADIPLPRSEGSQRLQQSSAKALSAEDFAPNIKFHNDLLDSHHALNSSVTSVREDLTRVISAIKSTDGEREKQISTLQNFMQKYEGSFKKLDQIDLEFKGLQASLEEKLGKTNEDTDKSVRQMDEKLTPKLKTLEKMMEGVGQKQSDILTDTLPKWHSELSSEIQKLATDLSRLQETTSERLKTSQTKLTADNEARELDAKSRMDGIAHELNDLKNKIHQVEIQAGSTETTLQRTSRELKVDDAALADRITNQGEKLEALLAKAVTSAKEVVHADLSSRIKDAEDAFKQADFERLRNQERLQQTIVDKVKDLSAASEASFRDAEASRTKMKEDLENFKAHINTKVANLAEDSRSRLQRSDETLIALQKNLTSLNDRLASSIATLQLSLQSQKSSLEDTVTQLGSTLDKARSEDGKEISILKAGLSQSCGDHKELADSVKKDINEVRSQLSATQAAINGQTQATNSIFERMDPMSQTVSDVVRDLGAYNNAQERIDGVVREMHAHVQDHSQKLVSMSDTHRRIGELEFYIEKTLSFAGTSGNCLSCGRSSSTFTHSKEASSLPSAVGWSVKQPHTTRPSSARSRGRGEAMDSSGLHQPAGTGIFAARFQRSTIAT